MVILSPAVLNIPNNVSTVLSSPLLGFVRSITTVYGRYCISKQVNYFITKSVLIERVYLAISAFNLNRLSIIHDINS